MNEAETISEEIMVQSFSIMMKERKSQQDKFKIIYTYT
jgi:hypothetical protein